MKTAISLFCLFIVSCAYDASIPRWPRFPGVTALQVAIGVGYTLAVAAWLIGCNVGYGRRLAILMAAFAVSGLPMTIGDMIRDSQS